MSTEEDWEGRYFHVDQVLDNPGPTSDKDLPEPEMVCAHRSDEYDRGLRQARSGERIPARECQDTCHWRRRLGL
jgi:hypothetical protein